MPKSIFGSAKPEPKVEASKTPKVLFGDPVVRKQIVKSDTILSNSTMRHRIKLTVEELAEKYHESPEVIELAHQVIITTNLDQIRDQDIVLIGSEAQKKYGGLVDQFNAAVNGGMIDHCKTCIGRIVAPLEKFSNKFFQLLNKDKKSVEETHQLIRKEMDFLSTAAPILLIGKTHLDDLTTEATVLKNILLSHEIAAGFLSQIVDNRYVDLLVSRQSSLLSSRLGVESLVMQIRLLIDAILQLVTLVQDVLLVEIPIWYTNQLLSVTDKSATTLANIQNQKLIKLLK